jgi:hypothetical protein
MSEDIRKMIDKVKNFKQFVNENVNMKQNIDFIFNTYPELSKNGTIEQYKEYLDNIFPSSVDKNIWYHGTNVNPNEIKMLKPSKSGTYGFGIYLQSKQGKYYTGTFGENIIAVVVDVDKIFDFDKYGKQVIDTLREKYKNMGGLGDNTMIALQNHIRTEEYDSIIKSNSDDKYLLLIGSVKKMFEPNHHILGTEQDVKMFSEFVKNKHL